MKNAKSNGSVRGQNSPADNAALATVKPTARSRITNGKQLFVGVDGRTREARRWRDLFRGYMAQTGGRHEALCRQLVTLIMQRERMDAALARGEPVDPLHLVRLCGAINRTLARLGLVAGESDDARSPPGDMTEQALAIIRGSSP